LANVRVRHHRVGGSCGAGCGDRAAPGDLIAVLAVLGTVTTPPIMGGVVFLFPGAIRPGARVGTWAATICQTRTESGTGLAGLVGLVDLSQDVVCQRKGPFGLARLAMRVIWRRSCSARSAGAGPFRPLRHSAQSLYSRSAASGCDGGVPKKSSRVFQGLHLWHSRGAGSNALPALAIVSLSVRGARRTGPPPCGRAASRARSTSARPLAARRRTR